MSHKKAMAAGATGQTVTTNECPASFNASMELSEEEIAVRAYSYWEERGCEGGSPEEDWFRAVAELTNERQASPLS
jgi:hypothetical protein